MGKKKSYEVSQSSSIGTMEEVELTKIVFTLRDDDGNFFTVSHRFYWVDLERNFGQRVLRVFFVKK